MFPEHTPREAPGEQKPHMDAILLLTASFWHKAEHVWERQQEKGLGRTLEAPFVRRPQLIFPAFLLPAPIHALCGVS